MEEKKTIIGYLEQVFIVFGFGILALNVLCILVGEEAQTLSSLYSMGRQGLSVATMMQFLGISICITGLRMLFFTDVIIKRMSITLRMICMMLSIIAVIVLAAVLFGWFPVDMWQAWMGFVITFVLCFAGSLIVTRIKEQTENRKMEEALRKLKGQDF